MATLRGKERRNGVKLASVYDGKSVRDTDISGTACASAPVRGHDGVTLYLHVIVRRSAGQLAVPILLSTSVSSAQKGR
jgi:hypothetical protein